MICKTLTETMGGTVGLESQYGKGSSFWADLPVELTNQTSDKKEFDYDIS